MMRAFFCFCFLFAGTAVADENVEKRIQQISELEKAGKRAEAVERSIALTNEHPNDVPALYQLWNLLRDDRKWDRQEAALKRAMAITPNDAKSCFLLGIIIGGAVGGEVDADRERRENMAIALFVRVTELEPKNTDAWFNLASIRAAQKTPDLPAAREAYRRAVELGAGRDTEIEKQIQWKP